MKKNRFYIRHYFFLKFTLNLFLITIRNKPKVILLYDVIPLFSFSLIRPFIFSPYLLWYHNHDVSELDKNKKISIGSMAAQNQSKMFPYLDVFSLPALDRMKYFPMDKLKGRFFYIPNFPSKNFYSSFQNKGFNNLDPIRIIYQGAIGVGHGIENIMEIMDNKIHNKYIQLILKGFISDEYKSIIIKKAIQLKINDRIEFIGISAYQDVPKLTTTCHIGIGIHTKNDTMNKTLGTASNKLYEYAACGLPILYYDNEHFKNHLGKYEWAFATDLTQESLKGCIETIISNYDNFSKKAIEDFNEYLNFENYFSQVKYKLVNAAK